MMATNANESDGRPRRWRAAVRLAEHHGMRLAVLTRSAPTWTGLTVNLANIRKNANHPLLPAEVPARRLFHEVGHLLVAPRERRSLPNFGHGWDSLGQCPTERVTTRWTSEREESDACLLGVALEIAMLGESSGLDTFFYSQGWGLRGMRETVVDEASSKFWEAVARLNEAGLMVGSRAHPELLPRSRRRAGVGAS